MRTFIPWDVWVATAAAAAIDLLAIFDPTPAMFAGAGIALFVYMIAEAFDRELS